MIPIGEHIGSALVKTRKLLLIVILTFFIGVFITMAEPDLIVLAGQISGVPDSVIIICVSLGVGLALVGAFLRILFQFPLSYILISCYLLAFVLSAFTGKNFLSIAWESGAVSTGSDNGTLCNGSRAWSGISSCRQDLKKTVSDLLL